MVKDVRQYTLSMSIWATLKVAFFFEEAIFFNNLDYGTPIIAFEVLFNFF